MKNKMKVMAAMLTSCICLFCSVLFVHAAGVLSIAVSSGSVAVGDSLTVTVFANGADNAEVTADMKISYDASKLEYVGSSQSGASGGGGTVTVSGSTVDVKFKAVSSGAAYIKAEGASVTASGTTVEVSGSSAGNEVTDAVLSGDNSLSSLSISQGTLSPAFKGSTTKYTASVGSDVSEVKVNPVTVNSKAKVESVTGNTNLKDGDNTITIVVKAENGTTAAYTITIKKGGTSSSDTPADTTADDNADEIADREPVTSVGGITVGGVAYSISEDFSKSDIPERFVESAIEYDGNTYQGIMLDKGQIGMLYLVSEAGDKKAFFVYDAAKNLFYPFVQLKSGEHFIIPMMTPQGSIPPENYGEASLLLSEFGSVPAYQYIKKDTGEKEEIVDLGNTETVADAETPADMDTEAASDFYLFYAINDEGIMGWYQFDNGQQTYQRLNAEIMASSSDEDSYNALVDAYNQLSDRYTGTKTKDRRLIAALIFISAVLAIVVINLILRGRARGDDDDDDDEYDNREIKKRIPKERIPRENTSKENIFKKRIPGDDNPTEKKKKSFFQNQGEDAFYEEDDEDTLSEFEDEPRILSRGNRKKEGARKENESHVHADRERKQEKVSPKQKEPDKNPDDDDIEFLDLNDL